MLPFRIVGLDLVNQQDHLPPHIIVGRLPPHIIVGRLLHLELPLRAAGVAILATGASFLNI